MRKLTIYCCFIVQLSFGQNKALDSLAALLAVEKTDSTKLALLMEMAAASESTELENAVKYAHQAASLAEKTDNKNWQPKIYYQLSRFHTNLSNLDSGLVYCEQAIQGFTAINQLKELGSAYSLKSFIYERKGETEASAKAVVEALRIAEKAGDPTTIAKTQERMAKTLMQQGQSEEAMRYALLAVDLCEKNKLDEERMYAYSVASEVFLNAGKNEEALAFCDKNLVLANKLNPRASTMTNFNNCRGNALKHLGRLPEAVAAYKTAQEFAKKANFTYGIAATNANLGQVYMMQEQYAEALPYKLDYIAFAEVNKDYSNLVENYGHTSQIYERLGDFKTALDYERKARQARDTTASLESDAQLSKLRTQYETAQKEATIATQEKQLSQQKLVQWLSIGVAVLLAGFLVFVYRSYRQRTAANRKLAAKNAENELLLKEIHHRVKNNLEVVSSLLALQSAQIDDQGIKDAMLEGQNRVQSIGIVHQKLYQRDNLAAIEMKDYFVNLGESVLDSFGADQRVSIEYAMEQLELDIDTAVPLGLIVNELLTNTLKYAFPEGQKGQVKIKLEKRPDNMLHLEVADNGVGKSGITKGTGFGGQLVALLTRQLDGKMREEGKNGTVIYFDFNLKKAA